MQKLPSRENQSPIFAWFSMHKKICTLPSMVGSSGVEWDRGKWMHKAVGGSFLCGVAFIAIWQPLKANEQADRGVRAAVRATKRHASLSLSPRWKLQFGANGMPRITLRENISSRLKRERRGGRGRGAGGGSDYGLRSGLVRSSTLIWPSR